MSILVIRHGLSEANNRNNIGTPAFGHRDAELMELGCQQARAVGKRLCTMYGNVSTATPVATSTLSRTQQTASEAGFDKQSVYEVLDEVEPNDLSRLELRAMLDTGNLPLVVLEAAEVTLNSRPAESLWFSHGLRIAGLCAVLGVYGDQRLIPHFGEIRELPL